MRAPELPERWYGSLEAVAYQVVEVLEPQEEEVVVLVRLSCEAAPPALVVEEEAPVALQAYDDA